MADKTYIAIPTNVGLIKIQRAMFDGVPLELTEMSYGEGNGQFYTPTPDMTELKNELGRTTVQSKILDTEENVTWIYAIIEANKPAGTIREIGLYDADGSLCFIANTPEIAKVPESEGTVVDIPVELGIKSSYSEYITIKLNPSEDFASKNWVDDNYANKQLSNLQLENYDGPVLWEQFNEEKHDMDQAKEVVIRDLSTGELLKPYGTGGKVGNYVTIDYIYCEIPIPIDPADRTLIENLRGINEQTGELEPLEGREDI